MRRLACSYTARQLQESNVDSYLGFALPDTLRGDRLLSTLRGLPPTALVSTVSRVI
jgi:hypothetical protein